MSAFHDLSPEEVHKLGQDAFTAYLDAAFEARKKHQAIDGFLVPAWTAAVRVIVSHLESWGLVRPAYSPITRWSHGTNYGYSQMGCLCIYCAAAYRAYSDALVDPLDLGLEPGIAYTSDHQRQRNQPQPGTIENRAAANQVP